MICRADDFEIDRGECSAPLSIWCRGEIAGLQTPSRADPDSREGYSWFGTGGLIMHGRHCPDDKASLFAVILKSHPAFAAVKTGRDQLTNKT
jgi:hypothetical protein